MPKALVYIAEPPVVTLDASGATLEYRSGGETYMRRYPRPLWRRFLEREIRALNEWEAFAFIDGLRRQHTARPTPARVEDGPVCNDTPSEARLNPSLALLGNIVV